MTARLPPAATIGALRLSHRLIAIIARLHAEKTLDTADDAADRRADDGTHRACDPPAFARRRLERPEPELRAALRCTPR